MGQSTHAQRHVQAENCIIRGTGTTGHALLHKNRRKKNTWPAHKTTEHTGTTGHDFDSWQSMSSSQDHRTYGYNKGISKRT